MSDPGLDELEPPVVPSVTDPLTVALERMVRILFKPFRLKTWLGIGFLFFVSINLFQPFFVVASQFIGPAIDGGVRNDWGPLALDWYQANVLKAWLIGLGVLLVIGAVLTVLSWIRSRGIIMLMHGAASGSGNVPEAWAESRVAGNSLFLWRILISTVTLLGIFVASLVLWLGMLVATPGSGVGGSDLPLWAIITAAAVALLSLLVGLFINTVVDMMVVPAMYIRRAPMKETWAALRAEVFPGQFWNFVGFVLFQYVINIGTQAAVQFLVFLTCCLATIPYLGSTLLLPAVLPIVIYRLAFYQQWGGDWITLPVAPPPPETPSGSAPPTTPTAPDEPGRSSPA